MMFQSTRPVWGATEVLDTQVRYISVSIHAPRVGRDRTGKPVEEEPKCFNPRAPCGARRTRRGRRPRSSLVSIHAPRVGRDFCSLLTASF